MDKLLGSADKFLAASDWKDLTLIKFCLCSMGIAIGTALPEKCRKPVAIGAAAVFAATYVPLMYKYFKTLSDKQE